MGCPPIAPEPAAWPLVTDTTLAGRYAVGDVLSTTNGTWVQSGNHTGLTITGYSYAWLRNGVPIGGATGQTYTLVSADAGCVIQSQVTASSAQGSASQTSASVGPVFGALPALAAESAAETERVVVSVSGGGQARPFASSSLINTPLPGQLGTPGDSWGAGKDTNSDTYIGALNGIGKTLQVAWQQYTFPVYEYTNATAPAEAPPVFMNNLYQPWPTAGARGASYGVNGSAGSDSVPTNVGPAVDPTWQASAGTDAQIVIRNLDTHDEWGFWQWGDANTVYEGSNGGNVSCPLTSSYSAGTGDSAPGLAVGPDPVSGSTPDIAFNAGQQLRLGHGTANSELVTIASVPDSTHIILTAPTTKPHSAGETAWGIGAYNGFHYNETWDAAPDYAGSRPGFLSLGAGFPYLATLVRKWEIQQGHIDHALGWVPAGETSANYRYPPATKSDQGTVGAAPMGSCFQLDPNLTLANLQAMGLDPHGQGEAAPGIIIARAMQNYGMYNDDGGGNTRFRVEDDMTAAWGTLVSDNLVAGLTAGNSWNNFRVVAPAITQTQY